MESRQYSEYEYFIDRLAELVIEYHISAKENSTEKEEGC